MNVIEARQQLEQRVDRTKILWKLAMGNVHIFLENFVWTIDTHELEKAKLEHRVADPIKQLPAKRPHMSIMTDLWQDNPLLVVCKSRQMMQTWLFCALALWDFLAHDGRLIMLQSKTEREAVGEQHSGQGLMGRCKFILDQIPPWLLGPDEFESTTTKLVLPRRHSTLWAIPQGADIIRSYTSAGILSDECGVQDEFEQAYAAAMPTIRGGGWFVALSTANPGYFERLYEDRITEEVT